MDQFFNKADEDKLKCDTNENKSQCDVEKFVSRDTQKSSEVHSTDVQNRAKMLEFWSEEYKVNVHNKREEETLLLMCLKTYQSDPCIMHLIEIECDVNTPDRCGESPLHLAIIRPTLIVALELIKKGANINARDDNDYTPLHLAVTRNHGAVCMLLYYGADACVRQYYMTLPLGTAIYNRRFDIIQTLMDYHEDEDLYKEINFFIYNYPDTLFFILLEDSRLFKLVWTYINHNSLTELCWPFLCTYINKCHFPTNEWVECLQLILQSDSIVDLIEHFNNFYYRCAFVGELLCALDRKHIEINKRTNIIFTVLSLGIKMAVDDFNYAFKFYGFGAELEAVIYACDYGCADYSSILKFELLRFILALNNDFSTKSIVSLLKNQVRCYGYYDHNAYILRFFSFNSNAKAELLEEYCTYMYHNNACQIKKVLDEVPEVPSLLELSRNRIYLSIRNGHKIKKPYHFHDAVNTLRLAQKLKDVIVFKMPIY